MRRYGFYLPIPGFQPSRRTSLRRRQPARRKIVLAPISLVEVLYLVEKNRIAASAFDDVTKALNNPNHVFEEAPFTVEVVQSMRQIARSAIPDMPDRIAAATALYLGVPLISRDGLIRASNVQTIW